MQLWEQTSTSTGGFTICNYIVILHSFGDRQPFVRKRQRGKSIACGTDSFP